MTTEKFLEFEGKKITLVNSDGSFYVALKPICEVLNVSFSSQRKAINTNRILSSTVVILTTVGADSKQREMLCLPEKYVYGWLLTINPKEEKFIEFQKECYEVLYNHFHNVINSRVGELQRRQQLKNEYNDLHKKNMVANADYKRQMEIIQTLKNANSKLRDYDDQLISGQMEFNF